MKTYNIFVFSYEELSEAAKLTVERNFRELAWDFPPSTFEGYNFTKDGDFCMLPSGAVAAPEQILFAYDELHESVRYLARISLKSAVRNGYWARIPVMDVISRNPALLFLKNGEFVNHLELS